MTIALGTRRQTWAILAADRRVSGRQPNGTWFSGMHVKVVCHRELPIAFATSGIGSLNNTTTSSHIRDFGATLQAADLAERDPLIIKLWNHLSPLVEDERSFPCFPGDEAKRVLAITLAWVYNGTAEFGRLLLTPEGDNYESADISIGAPDEVIQYWHASIGQDDDIIGEDIQDPIALGTHLRHVIDDGTEAEREILHNRCLTTGGPVDVAVVDAYGARRL
jgi:hypothetical protein